VKESQKKISYRLTKISMPFWLLLTFLLSAVVVFLPAMVSSKNCIVADYNFWQITTYVLSSISALISFSALMASITIMAVRFQRASNFIWNPQFTNFLRGLNAVDQIDTEVIYEQVNAWYKVYDTLLQKARILMHESREFFDTIHCVNCWLKYILLYLYLYIQCYCIYILIYYSYCTSGY